MKFLFAASVLFSLIMYSECLRATEGSWKEKSCSEMINLYQDSISQANDEKAELDKAILKGDLIKVNSQAKSLSRSALGKALIQHGLVTAAWVGRAPMIDALLEQGADPNSSDEKLGITPMIAAASCGHIEAMNALHIGGASFTAVPTIHGPSAVNNPLEAAILSKQNDAALWLIHNGFNPCTSMGTAELQKFRLLSEKFHLPVSRHLVCGSEK